MKKLCLAVSFGTLMTTSAMADAHLGAGDPAAGEDLFSQCQSCHVVEDEEGNVLAGRKSKTGPNLYAVIGRQAGTVEDFRYRPDIVAAGEAGLVWDAESLAAFVQDPGGFLAGYLDKSSARSSMSYRVRSSEDAANVIAYIGSLAE
jgi:cytochrome c